MKMLRKILGCVLVAIPSLVALGAVGAQEGAVVAFALLGVICLALGIMLFGIRLIVS